MDAATRTARTEEALAGIKEYRRNAIQALLDNPGADGQTLSKKMGKTSNTWQLFFGLMCKEYETKLWPAPIDAKTRKPFYSSILADFCTTSRGFTMKPEAIEGFRRLGIQPRASD